MKLLSAILVAAALPAAVHAETRVTFQGGRVQVIAALAPMAEVLDRLGQSTGITIIYEGARPQQRLTLALEAATAAEAVLRVLEGQGLNYAMRFDPSGTRVDMLLLSDTTPSRSSPKPASGLATTSGASAAVDDVPVEAPQDPPGRDAPAPEAGNPAGPGAAAPGENDFPAGFVNTPPRAHEGPPPADPSTLPGGQAPPAPAPPGQTPGTQGVWPPRPGASPFGTPMPIPMPTPRPER